MTLPILLLLPQAHDAELCDRPEEAAAIRAEAECDWERTRHTQGLACGRQRILGRPGWNEYTKSRHVWDGWPEPQIIVYGDAFSEDSPRMRMLEAERTVRRVIGHDPGMPGTEHTVVGTWIDSTAAGELGRLTFVLDNPLT